MTLQKLKKVQKRVLCVFLTAVMLAGSLSGTALADERNTEIYDSIKDSSFEEYDAPDAKSTAEESGLSNVLENPNQNMRAEDNSNAEAGSNFEGDLNAEESLSEEDDVNADEVYITEDLEDDENEISVNDEDLSDNSSILPDSEEILIDDDHAAADGETEPIDLGDVLEAEGHPESYWAGSATYPFLIKSLADLKIMQEFYSDEGNKKYQWRNNQLQHFKLMADITLTDPLDEEDYWEPIRGNKALCFDGNHHTISNVYIWIWPGNFNNNRTKILRENAAYDLWREDNLIPAFIMYADTVENLTIKGAGVTYMNLTDIPSTKLLRMGTVVGECFKCINCTVGDGNGAVGFDTLETDAQQAAAGGICYQANEMKNCHMKDSIGNSGIFTSVSGLADTATSCTNCTMGGDIYAFAGSISGISRSCSTIENCHTAEGISFCNYSGAANGICSGAASIKNCTNRAEIEADAGTACGIVSGAGTASEASLLNCVNYGKLTGCTVAGIVKELWGTISQCANYGDMEIVDSTKLYSSGGIVASGGHYSDVVIENCYNAGNITLKSGKSMTIGGILGWDKTWGRSPRSYGTKLTIKNCYNVGKISANKSENTIGSVVGELVEGPDRTTITGIHYLEGTASAPFGKGKNSAYKVSKNTDAAMKKASTYSGWDFNEVWTMGTGDYKYPVFAAGSSKTHTIILDANGGTIEGKSSIEVKTNTLGILRSAPRPVNGDARFAGWYTEAAGGERVTQEYSFVEDTTIYAHWGTYDPEKRVMLENLTPANGATGICFVDEGNWTSLKISFTTNRKIVGFDSLMGGLRIVDSDSGETVYELGTPNSLTKSEKKNTSKVLLKFHNSGLKYAKSFDIEVDDGFLMFEDADCYAFTNSENEWHFSTAEGIQEETFKVLNEFYSGKECDEALDYRFVYSDSFFDDSAENYNHTRTVWAFGLAMAGFESHEGGAADGARNARDMLDKFGFPRERFLENADYKKAPETETFGVCASSKEVSYNVGGENKSYTLIAVTTRGAGYGAEWYSNGKVGAGNRHQGFLDASEKILDHITDYIVYLQDNGIEVSEEIKIVMAGYSRAGAATNLAAARINENDLKNKLAERGINRTIKKENVFAYCFEPPATVKNTTDVKSNYKNITNIINPADLVPRVPLSGKGWNYTRYGVIHYLANDETVSHYESLKKEFLRNLEDRLGFQYDRHDFIKCDLNFIPTFAGKKVVLIPVKTYRTIEKSVYLDHLTDRLRKVITSADSFHNDYEQTVCNGMKAHFAGGGLNLGDLLSDIKVRAAALSVASGLLNGIEEEYFTFVKNGVRNEGEYYYKFGNLFQEHEPYINFAWLTIEDAEDHFTNGKFSVHKFNCPVNLTVRDSEGKIVAAIIDDVPQEIAGSSILSYIDDNGQKAFILPQDDDFSIEITGTDDGTMDYSVSSYSYEEGGLVDKTVYYDRPVTSGCVYTASIPEDDTQILKQNNTEIMPSDTFDSDISEYEVSVDVIEGDGSILGEGAIQEGDHVKLTACPDPGAAFIGWYEHETDEDPVSTENEYRFRVEGNDVTVYAKFSEVADDVFAIDIPDQTYTGSAIKPEVMIFDQKTKLSAGKDYTVSYKNNKNAYTIGEGEQGFNKKKAPQAVIKMKGNYSGKKTIYFKILPMELSSGSFSASDLTVQYNGKKQTPSPVFTRNGKKLKLNTDYVVEEYQAAKNDKSAFKGAADEDTVYTLTLTGKKNYTGSRKITLTILGKTAEGEDGKVTQVMMNAVKVPSIPAQTYRIDEEGRADITVDNLLDKKGKPLPFTVTWQKSKKEKYTFTLNVDYKVTYRKNSEIGTASIILTGLGNKQNENGIALVGTKTVSFKITGKNLKGAKISGLLAAYPYTGEEVIPTGYKVTLSGKELKAGDDYRVTFSKNVNAGTASMTVSGTGAYTGKVKKTFKIGKVSIGERGSKSDSVTVNNGEEITAVYKKSGAKPVITLKWLNGEGEEDDMILTEGVDFKVKYQNTSNLSATAPASKMPVAIITGTGSFTGSFKVPLTITPADFSGLKDHAFAVDKAYSTKEGAYRSDVTIKDEDGKILKKDNDYEITEYALVGTCEQETGFINEYFENPEILDANSIPAPGNVIRATVKAQGCYLTADPEHPEKDSFFVEYRILPNGKDISKAKVTLKGTKAFRGRAVKLTEDDFDSALIGKDILIYGQDYMIDEESYEKNTGKGTAKVTIVGIGKYGGRKTITFKIGTRSLSQTIWKAFRSLLG